MAWGSDANTEEELEKLAAVRGYFEQQFPGASIRDSYDAGRIAQVFRIETDDVGGPRDADCNESLITVYTVACLRGTSQSLLQTLRNTASHSKRRPLCSAMPTVSTGTMSPIRIRNSGSSGLASR